MKKKYMRIFIVFCLVCAAHSLFAVGKGTDTKGEYWEDASGVKHYYLFQKTGSGKWYSFAHNTYSREDARNPDSSEVAWVSGSIFTFEREATYSIRISEHPNASMYGIELETLNGTSAPHSLAIEYARKITLGEYGIHSVAGNTLQLYYSSTGEKLHLAASQTWSGPAAGSLSSAPFVIVPNYAYQNGYRGYVGAEDDVVLTIEGDTVVPWIVYDHPLTNMDVVVRHPAILSLPKGSFGTGNLYARTLTIDSGCGVKFGSDTSFIPATGSENNQCGGAKVYGIGSFPAISPVRLAETVILTNGATLTALTTTTVSGGVTVVSAGTTANAFSGTFELKDNETEMQVPDGATLDLTAATFTGTGLFSVVGEGAVKMNVQMDSDGYCELADWMDRYLSGFEGTVELTVNEGTLVLENAASIPSNCSIVTANDGAVLVVDDTGFDAATQLGGTKAVAAPSRLVVTDAEVTGEVTVKNGEKLLIFGNGLGENASLALWNGSTVMFRRTATLAAPTWYTNTVYYKTFDASVTGTVAGAISVTTGAASSSGSTTATLNIDSPGLLIFSGGGQLRGFSMNTGHADVTGEYDVYGEQNFTGGHMTVRDGGYIRVKNSWQYLRLDHNTSRDACLEIATGGAYEKISGNCYTYLGRSGATHESKLLVTGGSYIHLYDSFTLYSGGVIQVETGVFKTGRRITCNSSATAENAKIILRNGTMLFNGGGAGYVYAMFDGTGHCTALIDGNATMEVRNQTRMPDTTNETELAQCTWTCTEGSRLKMLGIASGSIFSFHNFEADGLFFDTNNGTSTANPVQVRIVDPKDPIGIGFVLPGKTGSKIVASNAVPALVASYVVPSGVAFDVASLPTGWHENFSGVSLSNLVFETGSSLAFPFFGAATPLAISGKLTLPESMSYSVAVQGERAQANAVPVIAPALGVEEAEGSTAFTLTGGVRPSAATLSVADGALAFTYDFKGSIFLLR